MAATTSTVTDLGEAVLERVGDAVIEDVNAGPEAHPLTQAAQTLAVSSYLGRIVLAGRTSSGSTWVQLNVDGGNGYASTWPAWAYEIARDAMLHGMKVRALANGSPFGSNLTQMMISNP